MTGFSTHERLKRRMRSYRHKQKALSSCLLIWLQRGTYYSKHRILGVSVCHRGPLRPSMVILLFMFMVVYFYGGIY